MKNPLVILICLLAIASSCKKSSVDQPNTPLKGKILIVDEYNHVTSDYTGVTVSVENSETAKIKVDGKGEFQFPELINNSSELKISISKPRFGTITNYYSNAQLDNLRKQNSLVTDFALLPQSSVVVNSFSGVVDGENFKMAFNVSLTKDRPTNGVTLLLTKNNPQISFDNWAGKITDSRSWTVPVTAGDNHTTFCFKHTVTCPCDFLSSGDTVYIRAYGDTYSQFDNRYIDNSTGKLVFPNINGNSSSSTISFVVP